VLALAGIFVLIGFLRLQRLELGAADGLDGRFPWPLRCGLLLQPCQLPAVMASNVIMPCAEHSRTCQRMFGIGGPRMATVSDRPSAPVGTPDLSFLQKFEPVVYYTKANKFFPTQVEHYVGGFHAVGTRSERHDELLGKTRQMKMGKAGRSAPGGLRHHPLPALCGSAQPGRGPPKVLATGEPAPQAGAILIRQASGGWRARAAFAAPGGWLFSLSFLLRGKVSDGRRRPRPSLDYNAIREEHPQYTITRVAHQNGGRCCSNCSSSVSSGWRRASTA